MKVWIARIGDTTPSIITPNSSDRPGEIVVELPDGDINAAHYLVEWQGATPIVTIKPGWEDEELEKTKERVWQRIKKERDRRMDGGFKVEVSTGVFKWYHSDPKSRTQHLGLTIAGMKVLQEGGTLETVLSSTPWKTMSGEKVPMTVAVAFSVFQAGFMLDGALYAVGEEHKAAMEASSDPLSYDFSTGWPEEFPWTIKPPVL